VALIGFNPRHNYEVRLTIEDGPQLGIYKLQDAIRIANEKGLDLVNISPQAKPPVAKIMDHGRFKYRQKQAEKEARKKQHVVVLKEVKLGVNIEKHDLDVKLGKIKEFLTDGCKVKIVIKFHGRENAHQDLGIKLLDSILAEIKEMSVTETSLTSERREIFVIVRSKHDKKS
jgi:translation initiation factor IF-3